MLLYRVFPYLSSARTGEPGHPLYLHPGQGTGRWDNPASYLAWYMAHEPTSAVGEVFASVSVWREEMFPFDHIPGARRALAVYQLPDACRTSISTTRKRLCIAGCAQVKYLNETGPTPKRKRLRSTTRTSGTASAGGRFTGRNGASGACGTSTRCAKTFKS